MSSVVLLNARFEETPRYEPKLKRSQGRRPSDLTQIAGVLDIAAAAGKGQASGDPGRCPV